MKLKIYFKCVVCGKIFDATDRGYDLKYQYGKPARCNEHLDRVSYK